MITTSSARQLDRAKQPCGAVRRAFWAAVLVALLFLPDASRAATFPGNASIQAGSGTTSLSAAAGVNALTVSCWFRIIIPTGTNLTDNMTILMDRTDGNEGAQFSYHLRYNVFSNAVEFVTRGTSGVFTNQLIAGPYLDRWYHVAITRAGSVFAVYVDGRPLPSPSPAIGDAVGNGLSIGGLNGSSRPFYGDIIEVAVYQSSRSAESIRADMFRDQRSNGNLRGYYKLGYSTNSADLYRNFAATVPTGTDPATKVGAGVIEFEETDQAGEQSLFDSRKNRGDDASAPLSGAFTWSQTLLARPVPGIAFDLRVGYSTATPTRPDPDGTDPFGTRPLGAGWRHSFETRLLVGESFNDFRLIMWDGAIETWSRTNPSTPLVTRHKEYRGELVLSTNFVDYEWTSPERVVYRFHDPVSESPMQGRLREIRDFNGNRIALLWNETDGILTNVLDSAGGSYQFRHSPLNLLTNVSFQTWQVTFAYDSTNRLTSRSITNTSALYTNANTTWQFLYNSNGLMERIVDPRAITNTFVQYDQYGRHTNEVDALGRTNRTEYGVPAKRQIRQTDAAGFQWLETFDRKGRLVAQADPLGNTATHAYDNAGNRTSTTEALGYKSTFGYDSRANLIARTNALGEITRWTYHGFFNKPVAEVNALGWTNSYVLDNTNGNLLRHFDDLGTLVTYTYATNGLVLTNADANGNFSRFAYDTNGFLVSKTDAAGATSTLTVNEVGWKTREVNALGRAVDMAYDINGRAVFTKDPLNRTYTNTFDANGNLLLSSDGKGVATRHFYDAVNQKTQSVDRAGFTNLFFFDKRGKLERAVNPLGHTATNFFDAANRLIAVSDPLGNTLTNLFDANGNLTTLIDQVGQRYTKTYDRLNRVVAESDPLGNTRRSIFDAAGRVKQVFTPNGYPSTHNYDGRGRLTEWVDAEGFRWLYHYDGNANITNIVDALNGNYRMTYGPRNERLTELNQDGKLWSYAYDSLLRLTNQLDPNGTIRTPAYDAANRIAAVNFSTGRQNNFNYDDNNNPTVIERLSGGVPTSTSFTYDLLDRAISHTDTHNKTVGYAFDAAGRMTNMVYPGNLALAHRYDSLGRLTNQVDWASRSMTYAYDKVGRMVARTYPNGVTQTNAFDTAGRLTGLDYRTNNTPLLALGYAYDRNGNKTGSSEKGTVNWPLPPFTDETSTFTPAGRLQTRSIQALTPANTPTNAPVVWTFNYDPSGNMTNAVSGAQSYLLGYDEDNRTTSLTYNSGAGTTTITNRYDALGRRVAKTVNGVQTGYVLSLTGGMERILCDLNPDSTTNLYVHGPDLSYRQSPDGTVLFFHADAQGNIIALTDTNRTTVAQYAYTPYGRTLIATNLTALAALNSQPYRFVGSQGVMEELPGLLFMRARYYHAEAGVFLSTDPVKKIGAGWKPNAYEYASGNPGIAIDPEGTDHIGAPWSETYHHYGNYGGQGWTGGRAVTYKNLGEWESAKRDGALPEPKDELDRLYLRHDYAYVISRTVYFGSEDTPVTADADRELSAGLSRVAKSYTEQIREAQEKGDKIGANRLRREAMETGITKLESEVFQKQAKAREQNYRSSLLFLDPVSGKPLKLQEDFTYPVVKAVGDKLSGDRSPHVGINKRDGLKPGEKSKKPTPNVSRIMRKPSRK